MLRKLGYLCLMAVALTMPAIGWAQQDDELDNEAINRILAERMKQNALAQDPQGDARSDAPAVTTQEPAVDTGGFEPEPKTSSEPEAQAETNIEPEIKVEPQVQAQPEVKEEPLVQSEPVQETPAEEIPAVPTQRKVGEIEIEFKGVANVARDLVLSQVELKVGDVYSQAALDRSVKALFNTGFFENVLATPREIRPGEVMISLELTTKAKVRTIAFEGNRKAKAKRLQREIGLKAGDLLGTENVAEATKKLEAYYTKRNFPEAKVVVRTTPLESAGLVDVTFVVNEGPKQKVENINFVGNKSLKAKELRKTLATKEESWLSFFTGSGKLDDEATMDDLTRLGEYYRNEGFLEVKVTGPVVTPKKNGAILTYTIVEGPRYRMGAQSVEGNTIIKAEELAKGYKQKAGEYYSPTKVDDTVKALRDAYGSKGYLQTQVRAEMTAGADNKVLNVKYTIKESSQIKVGSINVSGNTTTKSIVVARELLLAPGDVYSSTRQKTSENRLKNTGYFGEVSITDEPSTTSDDTHDMNVSVTEGKTGKVSLGVGFGSLDKASIFAEFTQGNFDIRNYKNYFRGGGQKARLYLSLGQESNQAIINFEEPWLFQRRLTGGFSLYRSETKYLSSDYNERRTGFEVYLKRRLVELVDGRLGYRMETVTLFDIDSAASSAIQAEAGSRDVSKITFELTRDTRDKVLFATRGNRLELNTAWAGEGLGGDTEYWMVEGRAAQYVPSAKWPVPQTLTLLGRAGTMDSFGDKEVPLFDRFFLGGPNSLRGFSYRKVGPTDARGEPLGGKTYGFWSAEYAFQLAPIVQLAAFYDAGFVNSGTADWDTGNYNDNFGIGLRILLMGAPLRLDYGIPITSSTANDNSGRFWFSFGTRF